MANNCPLNEYTFERACIRGDLKIIEWLLENKCPYEIRLKIVTKKLQELKNKK
jgi:hypothetical protein